MNADYECCVSFLQSKPSPELAIVVVRLEAARQAARDDCELCVTTGLTRSKGRASQCRDWLGSFLAGLGCAIGPTHV